MFTVSLHLIHMSKFIQYLSFCDWLVSVRFVVAYSRISILLTLNNTPSYVCIPHFVNPFICRCIWVAFLSCGYCCHAHGCEISLQNPAFNSFEYIAGSGFASSCGSFFFFFFTGLMGLISLPLQFLFAAPNIPLKHQTEPAVANSQGQTSKV